MHNLIIQEALSILNDFIHDPLFALFIGGWMVIVGVAFFFTSRIRARRRALRMVASFSAENSALHSTERIGHFGSFKWDLEHKTAYWSEGMYLLFGMYTKQPVPVYTSIPNHSVEKEKAKAKETWMKACTLPGKFEFTLHVVRPTGEECYLRFKGSTTLDIYHNPMLIEGVAHDITKDIEIDKAKTEFVSLASHQLKAPLTSMGWLTESLLKNGTNLTPDQVHYVETIQQTARNMMSMVNDLLNVSRLELGVLVIRLETIDVPSLVSSVVEEQRKSATDKNITLNIVCAPDIVQIQADKSLLRMVFQNLLSNAIKYTRADGRVDFELTASTTGQDRMFLRVADTGIGIPKKEQENVFKKLYRASNAQSIQVEGTGLGLYVIKSIVERVHGAISFESVENKGTTFFVTLPLLWEVTGQAKSTK